MDNEAFILANIPALLSAPEVKLKTTEIGGEWKLHGVEQIHPMVRNIEFAAILENGCGSVMNV